MDDVKQVDRDVARSYVIEEKGFDCYPYSRREWLNVVSTGELDNWHIVQAFARHRIAAEAATEAKQAAEIAALRERGAMLERRITRIKTEATDSYHMGDKNGAQHWATGLRDIENMADTALKDTTP